MAKEYKSVLATIRASFSRPSVDIKIGVPPELSLKPKSPTNAFKRPRRSEIKILAGFTSP